ncbi:MAG: hypothetical protein IH597_13715 [Bacteroidales bacterium]|nr:hypothetical protein [Bacteroidales bacterium]
MQKSNKATFVANQYLSKDNLWHFMRFKRSFSRLTFSILICCVLFPVFVSAQLNDTIAEPQKVHSPRKASIYSAVLPGLGQAYNRKYWKIPILYGGFGALYYITSENTKEYRKFLEAYRYVANKDTVPINNDYVGRYNEQQLLSGKNLYRRNLEIGYILAGVLYLINILDASVDAHLFDYDIGENLSLKVEPALLHDPLAARKVSGLALTLKF